MFTKMIMVFFFLMSHRETKARQWARPVREAHAVESAAASATAVEDDDGLISYVLPPGWKELVDKKTGRTYYVNRYAAEINVLLGC